jgi:hypothetical protein
MPRQINTEIGIDAAASQVWATLTDFSGFPEWNPFIRSVNGALETGSRLDVRIQPAGGRAMTFRPKLLRVEPGRELRWLGRFVVPGLFDGEHVFQIEPLGESQVRLVHSETFSGVLVPLFWRGLEPDTRRGFEEMNCALKRRVEASLQGS